MTRNALADPAPPSEILKGVGSMLEPAGSWLVNQYPLRSATLESWVSPSSKSSIRPSSEGRVPEAHRCSGGVPAGTGHVATFAVSMQPATRVANSMVDDAVPRGRFDIVDSLARACP